MFRQLINSRIKLKIKVVINNNSSSLIIKDRLTKDLNRFRCRIRKVRQFSRQILIKFRKTSNNCLLKLIKFNRKTCKTTKIKCNTNSWICNKTSLNRWATMSYLSISQRHRRRWQRPKLLMLRLKQQRLMLHKRSLVHMRLMSMRLLMQLIYKPKPNLFMHNWLNFKTKFKLVRHKTITCMEISSKIKFRIINILVDRTNSINKCNSRISNSSSQISSLWIRTKMWNSRFSIMFSNKDHLHKCQWILLMELIIKINFKVKNIHSNNNNSLGLNHKLLVSSNISSSKFKLWHLISRIHWWW